MSEYISEAVESVVSEVVEEEPVEEEPVEEAVEEPVEAPVEEAEEEAVEPASANEVVEEAVEPASANEVEAVEAVEEVPAEQVASDIREILAPVTTEVEESSSSEELNDDLKQRIAELDYLRECCSSWVGSGRRYKREFLTDWGNKSVSVDSNVNYEDVLNQLEKFPEIIKLWAERKVNTDSNHFKNIESYTLNKSLFNEKSVTEKVEVLEQLIEPLTELAKRKLGYRDIILKINKLY